MTMNPTVTRAVRSRTQRLLQSLSDGLYERDEAVRLALLTAVAGESIFLLGPPGVGKSLIARRLKYAFRDGVSFEYLMSKFSTPDEVFGPISIKKLKEEDKYERLTDRYLPGANIVFLDEIWKAGPAIQNALLTILNERIYRNGEEDIKVGIRAIITASNELPPSNKNLDPIWDRFLVRLPIGKIRQFDNFIKMVTSTEDVYADQLGESTKLSEAELDAWSAQIDAVEVPAEVLNTLQLLLVKIEAHNAQANNAGREIRIYDRRWKKLVRLLRTSAFLNGRTQVDLMDCFLLPYGLWNTPEHLESVRDMVADAVRKHGYSMAINLAALKKEVQEFEADVETETRVRHVREAELLMPVRESYYQIEDELKQFKGRLVSIDQFRKLGTDEYVSTNFYDDEAVLVNRIRARKGPRENTLDVLFNGQQLVFRLLTQKEERTEIIFKKPHRILEKYWDERLERLRNYIQQQTAKIETQAPSELNHLRDNLFVDSRYAEVVEANLGEVRKALEQLVLRLDKLHFQYANET